MHQRDHASTDFLSISDLLKATPAEDGGRRIVYFEASNETMDAQREVVLQAALAVSASFYLERGNVDIDHVTQIGAKVGIPNYLEYEIGHPLRVEAGRGRTFVKAQLYAGEGRMADKANQVWESLTCISPPARWYPSVGGAVLAKDQEIDPETKAPRVVIRKVRWTNVGLSRTPVNQAVPTVSTVPFGVLAKSWGPGGLDLTKALTAGGGSDVAALTGGAALAKQSLDRQVHSYWDFRDRMAGAVRSKRVRPDAIAMVAHAIKRFGLGAAEAVEFVEHFLADTKRYRSSNNRKDFS